MKYKLDICYSPYTFAYHNWAVIKKYINEAKNKKFKVGELFIGFFISNRFSISKQDMNVHNNGSISE